jgi:hypothetical protein
MTLGAGSPDATEGTIAPAGGYPFNFFTSRKWHYTEAGLTLRDHTAQAAAQLSPAGPNRLKARPARGRMSCCRVDAAMRCQWGGFDIRYSPGHESARRMSESDH